MNHSKKNRVRPRIGRTLQKTTDDNDMYNRAFPVGNALFFFFCRGYDEPVLPAKANSCLRSAAMKAPVGLWSDRTVLQQQMEGPRPDK